MRRLKQIYHVLAAVALLHVLGVLGLCGYLTATNQLSIEKVRTAVDLFRAAPPEAEGAEAAESGKSPGAAAMSKTGSAGEVVIPGSAQDEMNRLNLERLRMQAQQQLELAKVQMLAVTRRREEFEKERARQEALQEERDEQLATEGFEKELEVLSQLKPDAAVERLLGRPVDDAARLLMQLESRKVKKIVEAAYKNAMQRQQVMQIQDRMRELSLENNGKENESGSTP